MLDKEKIRDLLGSGLTNEVVANAVGCGPAYIVELMSDPHFANEVVVLRTQNLTAHNKRDGITDKIEDKLLDRLTEAVEGGEILKPRDVLHAFRIINQARRRGVPAHTNLTVNNNIVQLVLPKQVVRNFTMTPQGEVIDVEVDNGRQSLVTMSASTLLQHLARAESKDGKRYEEVAKYIPAPVGERKV